MMSLDAYERLKTDIANLIERNEKLEKVLEVVTAVRIEKTLDHHGAKSHLITPYDWDKIQEAIKEAEG